MWKRIPVDNIITSLIILIVINFLPWFFQGDFLDPVQNLLQDMKVTDIYFSHLQDKDKIPVDTNVVLVNAGLLDRKPQRAPRGWHMGGQQVRGHRPFDAVRHPDQHGGQHEPDHVPGRGTGDACGAQQQAPLRQPPRGVARQQRRCEQRADQRRGPQAGAPGADEGG